MLQNMQRKLKKILMKVILKTITLDFLDYSIIQENKKLLKIAAKVQEAYKYWKLVDRDNKKLNEKMDDIRKEFDFN